MRRRLIIAALFLLAGAVVNVGVAWGIALCAPSWRVESTSPTRADGRTLQEGPYGNRWVIQGDVQRHTCFGNDVHFYSGVEDNENPEAFLLVASERTGWPFRSLRGRFFEQLRPGPGCLVDVSEHRVGYVRLLERDELSTVARSVPAEPLWAGLIANTLFYAGLLWLPICAPFPARRLIRRRRGQCTRCGYDLRGAEHEACPECGVTA